MKTRAGTLLIGMALAFSTLAVAPASAQSPDDSDPAIVVDWRVSHDSGTEFRVSTTIHNRTDTPMTDWTIEAPYRHAILQIVGAVSVQDDSTMIIGSDQEIAAGASHAIEMNVISSGPVSRVPSTCTSSHDLCRVVVPGDSILSDQIERTEGATADQPEIPQSTPPTNEVVVEPTEPTEPTEPSPENDPVTEATPHRSDDPDSDSDAKAHVDAQDAEEPAADPDVVGSQRSATDQSSGNDSPAPAEIQRAPVSQGGVALSVAVVVTSDWGSGQSVKLSIRNDGPDSIDEWSIALPWKISVNSMWNAQSTSGGGVVRASNQQWNGHLESGEAVEIGLNGSPGAGVAPVGACYALTDHGSTACRVFN